MTEEELNMLSRPRRSRCAGHQRKTKFVPPSPCTRERTGKKFLIASVQKTEVQCLQLASVLNPCSLRKGSGLGGRCETKTTCRKIWQDEMVLHWKIFARPHREAVPRAVAQPPEPRLDQESVDEGGRKCNHRSQSKTRKSLGKNCQDAAWQKWQRCQE